MKNKIYPALPLFFFSIGTYFLLSSYLVLSAEILHFKKTYHHLLKTNLKKQQDKLDTLVKHNQEIQDQLLSIRSNQESLENAYRKDINEIEAYIQNFNFHFDKFRENVKNQKNKYLIKLFSPERSFLNCLSSAIDLRDHNGLKLCQHKKDTLKDTSVIELASYFETYLALNLKEAEAKKKNTISIFQKNSQHLSIKRQEAEWSIVAEDEITKEQQNLHSQQSLLKEYESFIAKHEIILNCDENTPLVSMENEALIENQSSSLPGHLYQTPRDDQVLFETGTCYSHVTKDMLTAAMKGKNSPSFFDLSSIYSNNIGRNSSLDGGDPCQILNAVYERGYCPYQFSAFEFYNAQAQKKPELKSLQPDIQNLWFKVNNLSSFLTNDNRDFFQETLVHNYETLILQTREHLQNFNFLSGITSKVFPVWKRQEFFAKVMESSSLKNFNDFNALINSWVITSHFHLAMRFANAIANDCNGNSRSENCLKIKDDVYSYLLSDLKKLIAKHVTSFDESFFNFHRSIKDEVYGSISHPHYQQLLLSISSFFSTNPMFSAEDLMRENSSHVTLVLMTLDFLSLANLIEEKTGIQFQPIIKYLDSNTNSLQQTLMAIAPGCSNKDLRRDIPKNLICESLYNPARLNKIPELEYLEKEFFRYIILKNILAIDSVPVGNIIAIPGGLHINSIVGMRFNKSTNRCQYLIRDSNGASSEWNDEDAVIKDSGGFKIIKPLYHRY